MPLVSQSRHVAPSLAFTSQRVLTRFSPLPRAHLRTLTHTVSLVSRHAYSTRSTADAGTIIHIPRANVYRFGQANTTSEPVFKNLEWTVKVDESWAIVGPAGSEKSDFLQMLMGYMRLSPPPPKGLYPFLSARNPPVDPYTAISMVSFTSRPPVPTPGSGMPGGGFFDYTARYGAMREELRATLRETLFSQFGQSQEKKESQNVDESDELEEVLERLDLKDLMDLPFVVLSNGQTRRARIAKALLGKPELLLLDEPLTGLDTSHRPQLTTLLRDLHSSRKPRILMALRPQDPLPEWITHVALVEGQRVKMQKRSDVGKTDITYPVPLVSSEGRSGREADGNVGTEKYGVRMKRRDDGKELVAMKNVNVRYHDRHVLKNISWTIREGEKWHLQGPNGSGKTTLLSLLLGTHPQSYSLPSSSITLFSLPRRRIPTITLQQRIGHVSPEIFSAFPRRGGESGMNVWEVIGTGFDGVFSYRPLDQEQKKRVDELVERLGPSAWHPYSPSNANPTNEGTRKFAETKFSSLPPAHQSLVLLLRALVSQPPLLVLDEPFAGMDARMISAVKRYLREELYSGSHSDVDLVRGLEEEDEKEGWNKGKRKTSVVFVSHWEDELPWDAHEVKRIRLVDGKAVFK